MGGVRWSSTAGLAATSRPPKKSFGSSAKWCCGRWFMPEYAILHGKPRAFYDYYERKSELQHQTHYCPGCGHGIVHKLVAHAVDELGIQDRMVVISPVG